jgi:hypothetical protein
LLGKLEKEGVARDPRFTPDAVTRWWRDRHPATEGVLPTPERCVSNWFEFSRTPKRLWLHSIYPREAFEKAVEDELLKLPFPIAPYGTCLFSFARARELKAGLGEHGLEVDHSRGLSVDRFSESGLKHPKIERREARNILSAMLRDGFERFAGAKGLLPYELSGGAKYYWFKQDLVKDDKVFFENTAAV